MIEEFQGQPLSVVNAGLGGSVLSRRAPGYPASAKPCGMDRLEKDLFGKDPDLCVVAYGFNDFRSGMKAGIFGRELRKTLLQIKQSLPRAVVVVAGLYPLAAWNLYDPFDRASPGQAAVWNETIRKIALKEKCLFADLGEATGGAPWMVSEDTVHLSLLGNALVANRLFETVARACSGVAPKTEFGSEAHLRWLDKAHGEAAQRTRDRIASGKS